MIVQQFLQKKRKKRIFLKKEAKKRIYKRKEEKEEKEAEWDARSILFQFLSVHQRQHQVYAVQSHVQCTQHSHLSIYSHQASLLLLKI